MTYFTVGTIVLVVIWVAIIIACFIKSWKQDVIIPVSLIVIFIMWLIFVLGVWVNLDSTLHEDCIIEEPQSVTLYSLETPSNDDDTFYYMISPDLLTLMQKDKNGFLEKIEISLKQLEISYDDGITTAMYETQYAHNVQTFWVSGKKQHLIYSRLVLPKGAVPVTEK